ncbi:uncharacterized protein si:dkey-103g5.4 isoform X3 [Dicentrarchus labrax]|uniref:uncharacterized protein si:dkey-103g5.4 isoform X3 n=1 Tax=Dicentrarchus labrax TaxID=13489 RepID=UPI0021F66995|nr:uncharacterized protein si:dkey-103g5.4 isoform X3 [Dicentrarchus labrax]
MLRTCRCKSFKSVWWLNAVLLTLAHGKNFSQEFQERLPCQPGFYCPLGSFTPVPCPKGTYGPTAGAVSIDSCLKCPPHHYCPRPGLPASLPCGPVAQQPLSGQDSCVCPGEGQSFQTSDRRCHCTLGYQPSDNGDVCVHKLYDVCRDGKARTQNGDCLSRYQWSLHCKQQVCQSAEDYHGYDGQLGLCICKEPPGRTACGALCRRTPDTELYLQCQPKGEMELVWSYGSQVSGISGSVLETVFKQWDSQGTLQCKSHLNSLHPVYIVQTTGGAHSTQSDFLSFSLSLSLCFSHLSPSHCRITAAGFLGLLSGLPKELQQLFPVTTQRNTQSSAESDSDVLWEVNKVENISQEGREMNSSSRRANRGDIEEEVRGTSVTGVLNPTACLLLGDVLLFTVDTRHYPQYDLDSLYNTNRDFDWGAFRQLKEELTLSWTPPSFFSLVFSQPGVYVFTLSSHQHKHLYVRVMPAGGQCYEPGPFFPTIPRHVTRVGISKRRNLLLRPDWLVTGGLLFGAVVILCLCVTLLILFHEYGWPEKEPIRARYRLLQLGYNMDDYSSKGSRVISLRKIHRNQQARMTQDSIQPAVCADTLEEFWDYEHQVDLEAFSSNTFYSLLLKQSLSVTTRLGQLTTEVKQLYQGVIGKLELLHPRLITEERMGEGFERMRREVEREMVRRKTLASQLRTLFDSQLQVLRQEQQAQQRVHSVFTAQLRECTRLLSKVYNNQSSCELHQQNLIQRLTSLVDEMGELVSAECQRQGAWGLLGEGTGAKLLCPDTGTVLTKDHIFGPDGSLRDCRALHCDSVTGLIRPNAHSHMLLSSGHTMAVPPDFFLHPQTGRVMPIAGNVAYDPASSTLVLTTESYTGDNKKMDSPLLPFIPYPTSRHSDQPLPSTRLRGLRPGQRLQLGVPMADPDTGVPVPILAVTIHPQTGLVYPLGGVHVCPLTRLPQPIQIGYPMLDSRTGNVVLTVGVSLDPVTGAVLPVGGVLLAESIIEPLSGRMVKVGGASIRAGQLLSNAGGFQALLDCKVLAVMFKVLEILKPLTEEWGSDQTLQRHQGSERGGGRQDHLLAAAKELQQAWGRSLHCQLQLQTRLEILLDWAVGLQQDGGTLGEMPFPGSDMCVPALLGMEYPDPMGSGLMVPVLGCQTDIVSGITIPLAGTMDDPDGKGLVAIRYGSQTVDPVTVVLAPVVGARLDLCRKTVVPVTASYWLTVADQTDSVQVEALQREVCVRNTHWQQQRQREEDILSDLDAALFQCLFRVTEANSYQVQWSGRQLREAAMELQDSAQTEAQRRAAQRSHLALILPPHVLHILTLGDEEEWDQQCVWHSELVSGLDKVDVCMEQLQQEQEKCITQGGDWATAQQAMDRELRQRGLWEQCCSRQTELEAALNVLHFVRHLSQLRADTAQAVLCGNFWYKEYGLVQCGVHRPTVKVMGLLQQIALPLLERLNQLLEDKQPASFSPNTCNHHISGLSTKHAYGLEIGSRVWTTSVPVVKVCVSEGISTQSLMEPINLAQSQDTGLQASSTPTHNSQRHTTSSGIHSQESQPMKESSLPTHISVPTIPEEEWGKLLELSPLFQLLKEVQLQLKGWACGAGVLKGELADKGKSFIDVLDAQWECEGELIPLDPSVLNPREFLVYKHGLFLIQTLNNLKLTPEISLQIADSLPNNNYFNNAFRNSFFYQEAEETLFVRRQRLQSVGGFSLLLLHCLSHVKIKDMSSDSSPAFQRLFFKILQACLGELFQARLGVHPSGREANLCVLFQDQGASSGGLKGTLSDSHAASLLYRLHKPNRGLLSEDEVGELHRKHRDIHLFSNLEGILRLKSSGVSEKDGDQIG